MGESEKHYVALRKGVGGWVKVKNTTTLHYVRYIICNAEHGRLTENGVLREA